MSEAAVQGGLPDVVASAVKQVVDDSRGLGLTWAIRLATVISTSPLAVIYDGDAVVMNAVSMIGPVPKARRVYVLIVPPSGNFIVGAVESSVSYGFIGANSTDNGTVCTTPAGGAETAVPSGQWDSEPTFEFISQRIYKVTMNGFTIESTGAGGAVSFLRIRKGSASTTGTQLCLKEVFHPAGFGGFTQSFSYVAYFKNSTPQTAASQLSLTINGVIGIGTWSLAGIGGDPMEVVVEDVGSIQDNVSFANTLISV